jgi:hypothetical protein
VVEDLVAILGSSFRRRASPAAISAWVTDPWSLGAYSYARPGRSGDRARLRAPVGGRLFIAGEATSERFYGTAHGAWLEGERAAGEALAALGVAILTAGAGTLPLLSIVLAASWTVYSLVRTRAGIDPLTGLLVEAGILAVPATVYVLTLDTAGFGSFGAIDRATDLKLIAAGAMTALPVVFYLNAARHLPFSALGLSSYLSPTLQLGIAILYGEPFTVWHAAAFGTIWLGLALYSADAIRGRQAAAAAAEG